MDYVVAMAENAVLKRLAEPLMRKSRRLSQHSGETAHLYGVCRYAAGSWNRSGGWSSRRMWYAWVNASRRITCGLWSPTYAGHRSRSMRPSTVRGPTSRTASRSCTGAGDRPHELHAFLGQPVAGDVNGRRLRADAGAAPAGRRHPLCPCAGVDPTRDLLKLVASRDARCVASCGICPQSAPWRSEWCRVAPLLGALPD